MDNAYEAQGYYIIGCLVSLHQSESARERVIKRAHLNLHVATYARIRTKASVIP